MNSTNNAFTVNFDCVTGDIRKRSYLVECLEPAKTGRPEMSVSERTEKTLAFTKGSHMSIGTKADSDKRSAMRKARI